MRTARVSTVRLGSSLAPKVSGFPVSRVRAGTTTILQPLEGGPKSLQDKALQDDITPGGLPPEGLDIPVRPQVAAGVDEGAAEPVALLQEGNPRPHLQGA
jgi:hypothetical protein